MLQSACELSANVRYALFPQFFGCFRNSRHTRISISEKPEAGRLFSMGSGLWPGLFESSGQQRHHLGVIPDNPDIGVLEHGRFVVLVDGDHRAGPADADRMFEGAPNPDKGEACPERSSAKRRGIAAPGEAVPERAVQRETLPRACLFRLRGLAYGLAFRGATPIPNPEEVCV